MKIEKTSIAVTFDSLGNGDIFERDGMIFQKLSRTIYAKGSPDPDEYTEVNAIISDSGIPYFFNKNDIVIKHPTAKLII